MYISISIWYRLMTMYRLENFLPPTQTDFSPIRKRSSLHWCFTTFPTVLLQKLSKTLSTKTSPEQQGGSAAAVNWRSPFDFSVSLLLTIRDEGLREQSEERASHPCTQKETACFVQTRTDYVLWGSWISRVISLSLEFNPVRVESVQSPCTI